MCRLCPSITVSGDIFNGIGIPHCFLTITRTRFEDYRNISALGISFTKSSTLKHCYVFTYNIFFSQILRLYLKVAKIIHVLMLKWHSWSICLKQRQTVLAGSSEFGIKCHTVYRCLKDLLHHRKYKSTDSLFYPHIPTSKSLPRGKVPLYF